MKKILTFIFALTFVMQSWADTFTVGDFKYETLSDSTVSIAKSDGVTLSGELVIPSSVNYGGKDYVVSKVAWGGFCDTDITSAILPKTITVISEEAFSDCIKLQRLTLPTHLTSIGRRAFIGCDAMQTIECHVFFPASVDINNKAFSSTQYSNTILYIPTGSLSAYKNHEVWQKFSNIQEKDMEDVDDTMFTFTIYYSRSYYS